MTRTRRTRRPARLAVHNLEDRTAPATLTVTGTGDAIAVDGVVTLREAIASANANANVNADVAAVGDYGTDTIRFSIPAADPGHVYYRTDDVGGRVTLANVAPTTAATESEIADIDPDHPHSWFTIAPASALPTITDPLILDGYTQPGAQPNTNPVESLRGLNVVLRIELDGSEAGTEAHGLTIGGAGSTEVRGLAVNRFARSGIRLVVFNGGNNMIAGSIIGTDVSGTVDVGNGEQGVFLEGLTSGNRIGGTAPADRNLVSGNNGNGIQLGDGTSLSLVQGNLLGTDVTGTRDLGNSRSGVELPNNNSDTVGNVIGGTAAGSRNVISGNNDAGVTLSSGQRRLLDNVIQGNFIGTDVTGTAAIGNATAGIQASGTVNTTIGGTTPAARNVISGNLGPGITDTGGGAGFPQSQGTAIVGNYIGTQADGVRPLGNAGDGVLLSANPVAVGGTAAGARNVIGFNGGSGVYAFAGIADVRGNSIVANSRHGVVVHFATSPLLGNSIFGNGGLGIELSDGTGVTANDPGDADSGPNAPNGLQNFPVLLEALGTAADTTVFGSLNSLTQTDYLVQLFASDAADPTGHGEGQTFLGETTVRTNSAGNVSFSVDLPVLLTAEQQVTATATRLFDHDGDPNTPPIPAETSEFSRAISGAASILELGQTIERDLLAGQELSFRLSVPPGADARLTAHFTDPRIGEVLVRVGDLPDVNSFDQRAVAFVNPDPEFLLPGSPAPYFIRVRGTATAGVPLGHFSLTAVALEPEINRIAPNRGSNAGQVTTTIVGTGLSAETVFSLIGPGGERAAASSVQQSETTYFVSFDLTGLSAGSYTVRAADGTTAAELADAFTVTTGNPGLLEARLVTPSAILRNRESVLVVEYANVGETDVPAPLLLVVSDNSLLAPFPQLSYVSGGGSPSGGGSFAAPPSGLPAADPRPVEPAAQFLAISRSGPAGVLPPGAKERLELRFQDDGSQAPGFHPSLRFRLVEAGSGDVVFDLASAKDDLRPPTVTPEAWDVIFSNLLARVGTTVGSYVDALRDSANYLSRYGIYTSDVDQLLTLHFAQADNALPGGSPHAATDAVAPASGIPLVWGRTFAPTVSRRFDLGTLGRGWSHPWDVTVSRDPETDAVLVRTAGGTRRFSELPDDTFAGSPLDPARLTLADGVFSLREVDATVSRFDEATGRLLDVTDRNGHQVSLTYVAGNLTRLDHSNGDHFDLRYNAAGRLDQLTDQAGRTTTYEYDPAGQHLVRVTGPDGVWEYAYETTAGAMHEHALKSVTAPDGTHVFYEYDGRGRVVRSYRDGDAEAVTVSYGDAGEVFFTDALDQTTSVFFNDIGQVLEVRDPLDRSSRFDYDIARRLDRVSQPQDTISLYDFDDRGNLTFVVKPDGRSVSFTYDPNFNLPTTIRDERGVPLRYAYDVRGNLTSILHADGSRERFTPDADGNLEQSVNRRDQAIDYVFDNRGLLQRKDHADGTFEAFTHDDRGNVLTATDVAGTTTFEYDPADRLTKVTYPDGRFLQYTFDAGGRRIRLEDQDGFIVKYSYDGAGRLDELTDGSDARLVLYTYDPAGRLGREDNGNGTFTTYGYDAAGQLERLVNHLPDESVSSRFDYTYDALGRRTTVTTSEGTTTFGYDAIGQLTLVVLSTGRTIEYRYDAAGNRTAVVDDGATTDYQVNDLNQYTRVGSFERTYDLDGNLIADEAGGGRTFTYDDEGRLLTRVDGALSVGYEYDVLGNRTARVEGGVRTEYLNDPLGLTNVVAEYDGAGDLIARYVHGGFGLVSRHDTGGAAAFYDFDAVGSTVAVTDAVGAIVNRYSYLPFGEALSITEAINNPFEFVGQFGVQRDTNGLDFMRARYYVPDDGRFVTRDPIGVVGGLNTYAYASNDPVARIDPSGWIGVQVATILVRTGNVVVRTEAHLAGRAALEIAERGVASRVVLSPAGRRAAVEEAALRDFETAVTEETVALVPGTGSALNGSVLGVFLPFALGDPLPLAVIESNIEFGKILFDLFDGDDPDLGLPAPPGDEIDDETTQQRTSIDPNDITGPAGFGPDRFVSADAALAYTIRFENLAAATAPAQEVVVTQTLDPDLDFTTFEFVSFGVGPSVVNLAAGRSSFALRFDLRPERNLLLDMTGDLNVETGVITWRFTSLDPATLELPDDPNGGFLPPNQAPPAGEGLVRYRVRPKAGSPTGTRIDAQARIVFDVNEPIDTPAIFHTVDAGRPSAAVNPLPATTRSDAGAIPVSWAGSDDGSGVATFDVYVSDNGGPFVPFLVNTPDTSAVFTGEFGHTYGFLALARDNVGHGQPAQSTAQATTALAPAPPAVADVRLVTVRNRVTEIVLTFSEPLAADPAGTLANYRLTTHGPDYRFGTRDDRVRALAAVTYDEATNTVRVRPVRSLAPGYFFRLTVEGDAGLTDVLGVPLDGDRDGAPGGDLVHTFGRGARLLYVDDNGDRVLLRLVRGGMMELTRGLSGEGLDLHLLGTVPGKSVLLGTVTRRRQQGDARTTLRSITGLDGIGNRLADPPFAVGDQ